ncbi:MAG: D-alanyl-D-alanine carboxypeptidase/D-alanyl-D-alanine-endopeptidase, partial [Pseudomonadota bacterium]
AEALLRRLALEGGSGSSEQGLERVVETLQRAGANPLGYAIADGSGMSIYNRLSPRVVTTLLVWASDQSWFEAFYETFPIGGVDGSLRRRFVGTPLQGRIHAKTGTLRGVNALSGYMIAESGQTLAFSILANDRPLSDPTAIDEIDAALVAIATVN